MRGRLSRAAAVDWGCGLALQSRGLSHDEESLVREIVATAARYRRQYGEDEAFATAAEHVLQEWGIAEAGQAIRDADFLAA